MVLFISSGKSKFVAQLTARCYSWNDISHQEFGVCFLLYNILCSVESMFQYGPSYKLFKLISWIIRILTKKIVFRG